MNRGPAGGADLLRAGLATEPEPVFSASRPWELGTVLEPHVRDADGRWLPHHTAGISAGISADAPRSATALVAGDELVVFRTAMGCRTRGRGRCSGSAASPPGSKGLPDRERCARFPFRDLTEIRSK